MRLTTHFRQLHPPQHQRQPTTTVYFYHLIAFCSDLHTSTVQQAISCATDMPGQSTLPTGQATTGASHSRTLHQDLLCSANKPESRAMPAHEYAAVTVANTGATPLSTSTTRTNSCTSAIHIKILSSSSTMSTMRRPSSASTSTTSLMGGSTRTLTTSTSATSSASISMTSLTGGNIRILSISTSATSSTSTSMTSLTGGNTKP
mmetsp:Transcript_26368/g.60818  ORF Transcript_26368/g.60818 Transcript_26368/m.60818 type:complete len:204 (-) Transcript_26368:119-730(-)